MGNPLPENQRKGGFEGRGFRLRYRRETGCLGVGAAGGFANRPTNPSAAVGWVKSASRSAVYGMPPSIAVWTTAIDSLASAPNAVKPRLCEIGTNCPLHNARPYVKIG